MNTSEYGTSGHATFWDILFWVAIVSFEVFAVGVLLYTLLGWETTAQEPRRKAMAVEIITTCDGDDCGAVIPNDAPTSPHFDINFCCGEGKRKAWPRLYFSLSGGTGMADTDVRLCAKCWQKAFEKAVENLRGQIYRKGEELNDG